MIGPMPYIGGKRRLAPLLVRLLPPHVTYVEPFAGGAQVLFHKPPSRVEVLNDLDGEVMNFFRMCKLHSPELSRTLRLMPASRRLFSELAAQDPSTLTEVQRAARFVYLQKNCFGGRVRRRSFHFCVTKPSNFNPTRLRHTIAAAAKRLEGVQLESVAYERVLEQYDRPTTLFYIDPPYVGVQLYRFNFGEAQFTQLAAALASLKGKFVLSINDHPLAQKLFGAFHCQPVRISYTATRSVPRVQELVFANFPLPDLNVRT